jgi:Rrf2 family transcriptional regulator, nitric oxide-sensitive transcriptional repressor
MRLSSFSDFGLRILMVLADDPSRSCTTKEIAAVFGLSRHHLTKVVGALAEAGFIITQRGAAGGFRLARPPEQVRLGDVIRELEAGLPLVECFRADGGSCRLAPGCRLKPRLNAGWNAFIAELNKSTLAECAAPLPDTEGAGND